MVADEGVGAGFGGVLVAAEFLLDEAGDGAEGACITLETLPRNEEMF